MPWRKGLPITMAERHTKKLKTEYSHAETRRVQRSEKETSLSSSPWAPRLRVNLSFSTLCAYALS